MDKTDERNSDDGEMEKKKVEDERNNKTDKAVETDREFWDKGYDN